MADVAAGGVLAFSVLLASVEVGRIAVLEATSDLLVAVAATCVFLPPHLWHLRYGLRGDRPPRSGRTLAVVAVAQLSALALIGPAWSPMLAALATSALIVLRAPWSLAALVGCVCAPIAAYALHRDLAAAGGGEVTYLMVIVLFRASVLFTLVWLVAGAHELAASKAVAAHDAAQRESAAIAAGMRATLQRGLDRLVFDARRARRTVFESDMTANAERALDGVLALANEVVDELRRVVASARRALPRAPIDPGDESPRPTPVGQGLTIAGARRSFAVVHVVVLGFILTAGLGLFGGTHGDPAVIVVAWSLLCIVHLVGSLDVARGRRPRIARAQLLVVGAVVVGVMAAEGLGWRDPGWILGATVAMTTRGRTRIAALALLLLLAGAYDVWRTDQQDFAHSGAALLTWDFAYAVTITALGIAGLYGSARLIGLLGELDELRELHIQAAVDSERRRVWGDLHDVLGQTLAALVLKADLARRLLSRDRRRVIAELDELIDLAVAQAHELHAIARHERATTFDVEAARAVRLLRAAGIKVRVELDVGALDETRSAVLGWAAREGSANILRHSCAQHCTVRATRSDDAVTLELHNDGAIPRAANGTGLAGLAARAEASGGRAEAASEHDGWFCLRVVLPAEARS